MKLFTQYKTSVDFSQFGGEIGNAVLSPDAQTIAATFINRGQDPRIVVAQVGTDLVQELDLDNPYHHPSILVYSPDSSFLVSDSPFVIWDTQSWTGQPRICDPDEAIVPASMAVSPDSRFIVIGTFNEVRLWSVAERTWVWHTMCGGRQIATVGFTPDGKSIVVSGEEQLGLLDAVTGDEVWKKQVNCRRLAVSKDGFLVEYRGEFRWRKFDDATTVARVHCSRHDKQGHCQWEGRWSPCANLYAMPTGDWVVIHGTRSGEIVAELTPPASAPRSVSFSSDSRSLVVGTEHGKVFVWKLGPFVDEFRETYTPLQVPESWVKPQEAFELESRVAEQNINSRLNSLPIEFDMMRVPGALESTTISVRLHPRPPEEFDPARSKLGGNILWPQDEAWPTCEEHNSFFIPVLQIRRDDVQELRFIPGMDLLQLVWCPHYHEKHDYGPHVNVIWRRQDSILDPSDEMPEPDMFAEKDKIPVPCHLNFERVIEFSWDGISKNVRKQLDELQRDSDEINFALQREYMAATGCKVGGYPHWINGPRWPDCKRCGKTTALILTFGDHEFAWGGRWHPQEERHLLDGYLEDDSKWSQLRKASHSTGLVFGDGADLLIFYCYDCEEVISLVEGY